MNRSFTYEMLLHELGVQKADRLSYIDFLLQFKGSLSRADLTSFFGIKEASASQVISEYRELRPNNVEYDRSQGKNVIQYSTFSALIEISAENGLGMLANGFNKTKLSEMPLIEYDRIGIVPKLLDVNLVSKVTRAISQKTAIHCLYLSASSSNHKERVLYPTAIFYDGINWMFRAFHKPDDGTWGEFKCFNFSRLENVIEQPRLLASAKEKIESDKDWSRITPIQLAVHPRLKDREKRTLKYEFGISADDDELIINCRAVLFYYLVQHWKIDVRSTVDDSFPNMYNFWLKNRSSIEKLHCMQNVFWGVD